MLVAGPPRSGRTTLLAALAEQAAARPLELVVAAPRHSPLVEIARRLGALHVAPEGFDRDQLPAGPTVLLVDDCETFADRPSGDHLTEWLGEPTAPVAVVTAGRNDAFATAYRGLTARARHAGCTVVLRPAPVDGELLGVRLPRWLCGGPPGRGVVVARRDRHPLFAAGEAVAVQVVQP
jgi:S-DNA-T family DNA segregation ATPase FtsK/SpoIIIE